MVELLSDRQHKIIDYRDDVMDSAQVANDKDEALKNIQSHA